MTDVRNPGAFPFPTAAHHPAHSTASTNPVTETPGESAIDHGIEESFPASDPVSVSVSKSVHPAPHDATQVSGAPATTQVRRAWRPSSGAMRVGAGVLAGGAALAVGYALTKFRRTH
jgi:hypothetical protein